MTISSRVNYKVLEVTIESGNTAIKEELLKDELNEFREEVVSLLDDIDYLIEKLTDKESLTTETKK